MLHQLPYSGKVWRGESLANLANRLRFAKLKPSKLVVTIDNPLADLFIRQTFFHQTLKKSRFTKHSARQTFPLYGKYTSLLCIGFCVLFYDITFICLHGLFLYHIWIFRT